MTRRAHWLQSIQTAPMPEELVVFDTETVERQLDESTVEHVLAFGWACRSHLSSKGNWCKPDWFRFEDARDFWKWLESRCRSKKAINVYCHNANFDWQTTNMCQILPELGWQCDAAIINDPPNYFRWRKGTKTLKLLDTTNYWRVPLRKIGARLGMEKLDLPANWSDKEQGDTYCRRDCEILLKALQEWIAWLREHDLGGLSISLASQAWTAYRHRFMDYPIFIDTNDDSHELARAAYYGGRTEAWTVGAILHNLRGVDINSMYPHVMRECEYPTRLHGVYRRVTLRELERWTRKYCVIAHVTLTTDEPIYPQRMKHGLVFPVGTFDTVLSTPELVHALRHGHIEHCYMASVYDKARIFTSFVDDMYEIRLGYMRAGDETATWYTKIMMNSLYGKFGQRGGHEEIIGRTDDLSLRVEDEIDLDTGKRYRIRYIAGLILSRSLDEESSYSHPAISAHVTAYARMLLWSMIKQAGFSNVHYMDTDSLHVTRAGLRNLRNKLDEHKLGYLKIEKLIDRAIYYGPKDYELDGVRTIKGVRANAREVERGVFEQDQWVSLRGSAAVAWSGGPLVRRIHKTYRRVYRKGNVSATGRVRPFVRERSPP